MGAALEARDDPAAGGMEPGPPGKVIISKVEEARGTGELGPVEPLPRDNLQKLVEDAIVMPHIAG